MCNRVNRDKKAKVTRISLSCSYQLNITYSGMILHQKYFHNYLLSQGWIEVLEVEKQSKKVKCSRFRHVHQRHTLWQLQFHSNKEGAMMPRHCVIQEHCVKWGYWVLFTKDCAPFGSSLSINLCHHHLQQHQDQMDFHRRLSYIFIFRVTLTNLEKTF